MYNCIFNCPPHKLKLVSNHRIQCSQTKVKCKTKLFNCYCELGMDAPFRGEPSPRGRGVPRPAPPHKNDQNRREVAGQIKGPNLNFLQKRKLMMEQYHNTEHE